MIVPTTLMGGTLPVLSALMARESGHLGGRLSFLYAANTVGAAGGAIVAGFWLLRQFPVTVTTASAVGVNVAIGLACVVFRRHDTALHEGPEAGLRNRPVPVPVVSAGGLPLADPVTKAVLWGIGISGFCALGYEVLWTRVLIIVVGASDYGFTVLLAAFLLGIGFGGALYGLIKKSGAFPAGGGRNSPTLAATAFGATQILIGVATLTATRLFFSLPAYAGRLQELFSGMVGASFASQQLANLSLSFTVLAVPATLMGLAFPLAVRVNSFRRGASGRAVGEVAAFNTVGAVLGAAVSGFVLIYLVGIERSLQLLCLVNVGLGVFVLARSRGARAAAWAAPMVFVLAGAWLIAHPDRLKSWNTSYFSLFRSIKPEQFGDARALRFWQDRVETLYYAESAEAIVGSVRDRETGLLFFSINGRTEASNELQDVQNQFLLGHLPMLLHPTPQRALVLGAGSGMTLGAMTTHPGVERVVLAEIEPGARWGGPSVTTTATSPTVPWYEVFIDGRNYLATTKERFDVITADPIHPWSRGAAYLYTTEYFQLAAKRLAPGGSSASGSRSTSSQPRT